MIVRLAYYSMILLAAASCGRAPQLVEIPFVVTFDDEPVRCTDGNPQLTDLRLYVSDVALVTADSRSVPVELSPDGAWQRGELALLDFEDGQGGCENGTGAINTAIRGSVPDGDYHALRFVVGVPFELNHGDPLQASPPLGDAAMHWHWRGGYKFLRAGVRVGTKNFWLHLGSTGCEGRLQDITGCNAPNRVAVAIDDFDLRQHAVRIDLAALIEGTDIAEGETVSCSSSPAEDSCAAPFAALGLRSSEQSVFGIISQP